MTKLNIIKSTTKDGIMSIDKDFFPNLTIEERNLLYESTIERFLNKLNIKDKNFTIINEKNTEYGYKLIGKSPKNTTLKETVVIKSTTKNYFVGVETADDPIIIATVNKDDQEVCAISLGSVENIHNELLDKIVGYLINETGCTPFDISFYISACPNKENLIITDETLINSRVLKQGITKEKDGYHLDLRFAIVKDLDNQLVDPNKILLDPTNTIDDLNHYSKLAKRNGKHLIGVMFTDEV